MKRQSLEFEIVTANIIQGLEIGPTAYVVNAGNLKSITPGNFLCK